MATSAIARLKASSGYQRVRMTTQWAVGSALVLLLGSLWSITANPVQVMVDGVSETISTHRRTVSALLIDLGVELRPLDRVTPDPDTPITPDLRIRVDRAWPVRILTDGRDLAIASWGKTPREVLLDAGVAVDPHDEVLVDGQPIGLETPLPERSATVAVTTYDHGYAWQNLAVTPLQMRIRRSIPIVVEQGGLPFTVRTTAQTVGEALRQAKLTLYLGDRVQPNLGSQVTTGLRVMIERSTPLSLRLDGRVLKTRTRAKTVADALTEMGVVVAGLDIVTPTLQTELYSDIKIGVVRVQEAIEVEEEIAPFETVFEPDTALAIDTQAEIAPGAEGITRQRTRVRYADGQEVNRVLEDTWVAQEPAQRVIAYGQQIEPKTFTAPDGSQITYWRRIRMLASSYSAATAGVSPDATSYGRTFTGDQMRKGIVAVDGRIIPLRSKVFVPGYGYGDALDTGGAIVSRRIDLGYDDNNLELWNRWVDVYLLWPPPPDYQITWVLPNFPRVPDE